MEAAGDVEELKAANAKELHRAVREEGEAELDRSAGALFWSGLAGGLAIVASLLAEGALHHRLPDAPWRELVVGLGYSVGYLIVILGRMQFFTESTITAVLPLATRPSLPALGKTLRMWAIVLTANLLGTLVATAAIAAGLFGSAELHAAMDALSAKAVAPPAAEVFWNAIPAGFLIAIIAWSLPNAREQAVLVIVPITYLVGVAGFSHAIVGSANAFLLMWDGRITPAAALAGFVGPAALGNLIGGGGIFALLAHGQVRGETMDEETP